MKIDFEKLLGPPCAWCGYNGELYWQAGSHAANCPFWTIAGEVDRRRWINEGPIVFPQAAYDRGAIVLEGDTINVRASEMAERMREEADKDRKILDTINERAAKFGIGEMALGASKLSGCLAKNTFHDEIRSLCAGFGDFLVEKNIAYGDATSRIMPMLRDMFPDGVKSEEYESFYYIGMALTKLCRVAASPVDPAGEDPWRDVMGYAALACAKRRMRK